MRKNRLYMIIWQTLLLLRDNREVVSGVCVLCNYIRFYLQNVNTLDNIYATLEMTDVPWRECVLVNRL